MTPLRLVFATSLALTTLTVSAKPSERLPFNDSWRFHRGDAPDAGDRVDYEALKPWVLATRTDLIANPVQRPVRPTGEPAGSAVSFAQKDFDDTRWAAVTLPHDWAIAGPFDQDLPGETGKLPWQGVGWYRKGFDLAPEAVAPGQRVALQIDGAMSYSAVWLNGRLVGGWPYGYTSYELDLTPYAQAGPNVLAIRLDNPPESSRWYPGSGLYRNVWLRLSPDLRIAPHGVFVTTPRVTTEEAIVQIDVTVEYLGEGKRPLSVVSRIHELDAAGRPVSAAVATTTTAALELDPARARESMRSLVARVPQPRLWDLATPHRYVTVTEILGDNGAVIDRVETPFGIRTIGWDADRGFLLNGRVVPLHGVCQHHDLGALGAAFNVRAAERQLEILREMGANAIRTAHNPPAPELLELCDRLGILVQVEAFDCWRRGKKWPPNQQEFAPGTIYFDYARVWDDWHERDLRQMIRRDRNHPSVVMWSIGNEVIEQWFSDGWRLAARLAGIVREEDRTRPITAGFNGTEAGYSGFQTAVDAVGYNYRHEAYAPFRAAHPTIPVYSSESASTLSSRGYYAFPVEAENKLHGRADFHVSSYDLSAAPWSSPPDIEFAALDRVPGTAGEFVWTGFDYLGEPTPYNSDSTNLLNYSDPAARARAERELAELGRIRVPSRSSYFGIIDLAGFPKDRFYLYQARWRPDLPMAHILPHWNWPDRIGQVTPVHVYSSGDEAELFLNGRSLGRRTRGALDYRFRWDDVAYEPGELRVVTWKNGRSWAEATRRTTGPAARLDAAADRTEVKADAADLVFVKVTVADERGDLVPRGSPRIRFRVEGPGELVATDNGDPTDLEAFPSPERRAFHGLALAIVRPRDGVPGTITVHAEADGLTAGQAVIRATR
jgi:beta-galactosidase